MTATDTYPSLTPIDTGAGPDGLHTPFNEAKTKEILDVFHRDGVALIPGVFSRQECQALRDAVDRCYSLDRYKDNLYAPTISVRMFETDNLFRDALVREPIISLAEKILGAQCHLMAQNCVRNGTGKAIDTFHADVDVDCGVEFALPPEIPCHDPRIKLPVFRMTVQIMLTDCDQEQYGPTQFVLGSHYSGRHPNDPKAPSFMGRGPTNVLCKAGDIYLHNGQAWHRGAPNNSHRTRYLLQIAYCQRWVSQRFFPFIDYKMPPHVWEGASDRLQRVLGRHPKGPYG
jgi:ectoine hydroxylase-related dioxygenase (phytanoyl-CoA dioxygenase family)